MRKLLAVVGLLIALLGVSQIVWAAWWTDVAQSIVRSSLLRLWGLPPVVIGIVMIIAAARRLVGLRLFVIILGVYVVLVGLALLAAPELFGKLMDILLKGRSSQTQAFVVWLAGTLRVIIGVALLYAVAKPLRQAGHTG